MNTRSKLMSTMVVFLGLGGLSPAARGGTVSVFSNYDDFVAAAGAVRTIDFETLPDGSPSLPGTMITPEFNYTAQGVTFSSYVPSLYLAGNPGNFGLRAESYPEFFRNWIIADFVVPVSGFGVFFPGHPTVLTLFDKNGGLVASVPSISGEVPPFLGVVSGDLIAGATIDTNTYSAIAETVVFAPIPEPSVLLLIIAGAFAIARKLPNREPR